MPAIRSRSGYVPHKTRHQDGGNDEINVGGLSGLLADSQKAISDNAKYIVAQAHAQLSQEILSETVNFENLLFNGRLEEWSQGVAVAPTGWFLAGAPFTPTVARESTVVYEGQSSLKATCPGGQTNSWVTQQLVQFLPYLKGRAVTFQAWCKCSTASNARLWGSDGSEHFGSYHTGGGEWEPLTLTWTVNAAAATLSFKFAQQNPADPVYWDAASAVIGTAPAAFEPGVLSRFVCCITYQTIIAIGPVGNTSWTELDLSSYIPVGTTAVYIELCLLNSTTGEWARVRVGCTTACVYNQLDSPDEAFHTEYLRAPCIVRVGANRKLSYYIAVKSASTAFMRMSLIGYWL